MGCRSGPEPGFSLSLVAYLSVLMVWSALELPGEIQAIIIMRIRSSPPSMFCMNESRRTIVNLLARNGMWISGLFLRMSRLLMHSLSASNDLFISAPSSRRYLLLL